MTWMHLNSLARSERRLDDRTGLREQQWIRFRSVWESLRAINHPLYQSSLESQPELEHWDDFRRLPFLTKSDLLGQSRTAPSRLFALPPTAYSRVHQTSGSRGWPMPIFDTAKDWRWWLECWQYVLDAADVTEQDAAMMAFSFGPFIGFWTANDALVARGCTVVPGGGLSSLARLRLMLDRECTVLCCTPTYAMHLASVAKEHSIDLRASPISRLVVAGEPGGSVPEIRKAIEQPWGARVIDHAGASELGAWGFPTDDDSGLHVIESEFIPEFFTLNEQGNLDRPANEGESSELVMTNLGRFGGPAIRYRTGDIVRPIWDHSHACRFVKLDGGVLGRADDMLVVRGVNVFPSSIEAIVREVIPDAEFQMIATRVNHLDQLEVQIESNAGSDQVTRLQHRFHERLALRINVQIVAPNSLPRWEAKAKRFVDQRS